MKAINKFLKEAKFVTPIHIPSENEIRFVINERSLLNLNVDKSKSLDYTDMYVSTSRRFRQVYLDNKTDDYDSEKIYELKSEPGKKEKTVIEIDHKALEDALNGKKIIMKIIKKGVGQITFSKIGTSGYCERIIAMANSQVICDELQIEFEDINDFGQMDYLIEMINPEKVFQCGLIDYVMNKAKFQGRQV